MMLKTGKMDNLNNSILQLKLERKKFKLEVLRGKYIRVDLLKKVLLELRNQEETGKTRKQIIDEALKIIK